MEKNPQNRNGTKKKIIKEPPNVCVWENQPNSE